MLTFNVLLDDPALDLRLLVDGPSGALEKEVLWVHNTELADPSTYVRANELVLTNGLWLAQTAATAFVHNVRRADAAGIVFGLRAEMRHTPPELVGACRAVGLPLAEISIDVPFTAVTQAASVARAEQRHQGLLGMIRRGDALANAISAGAGTSGVLRLLRRDHDLPLAVVDRTGRLLASVASDLDASHVQIAARALAHHPPPLEVDLAELGRATVFLVGAVTDADAALLCVRPLADLSRDQHEALEQTARFLSLEVAKRQAVQATELRFTSELLDMILSGGQRSAEVAARLRSFGIDPTGTLAICALAFTDLDAATLPGMAEAVTDFFLDQGQAVVVAVGSQDVVTVLPWVRTAADLSTVADSLVRALTDRFPGRRAVVGLGELASSSDELRQPLVQAREACRVLRTRSGAREVAAFSELGTHQLLLGLQDAETLRGFADSVLAPLRAHDRMRSGQLQATLRAFLDNNGQWASTAAALYVHVNTLRNRVDKITELTGRDIHRTEDRVDLFLALAADEMSRG